ncbi:hypothetical protein [Pseudomonas umsongensis]|uniref:hypothetical protein n=1 Tax=Pseudomonas umsongensis TaxID=198618 RepID=UPI0003695034|nr:hypothetical protein [Pseudomonas umsongensis]
MAGLLEFVFELVDKGSVLPLLTEVINGADSVVSAQCSETFPVWRDCQIQLDAISAAMSFEGEVCVLVNVRNLKIMELIIGSVLVRILKYDGVFDIDFSFDEIDVVLRGQAAVDVLLTYSKEMADKFEVADCFYGAEPASDEDTRFSTSGELGPFARKSF